MGAAIFQLAAVLAVLAVGLILAAIVLGALVLLRPPRMTDGRAAFILKRLSPGDLGLAFEQMNFTIRDEHGTQLAIAAWWIAHPHAMGRCVVLIHGYSDAKVGSIAWAPLLHSLGLNILALDLRAHGESGGRYSTGGYFERHDVGQVLNQLRAARPNDTRRVMLFGISLGAAVAAATATQRDDLCGVILEGPFADFRRAIVAHSDLFGMPGSIVPRLATLVAQWISGADFATVCPRDMIGRVPCPVMVIHGGEDPLMDKDDAVELQTALLARADYQKASFFWCVEDAGHVLALAQAPQEYRNRIGSFVSQIMEAGE